MQMNGPAATTSNTTSSNAGAASSAVNGAAHNTDVHSERVDVIDHAGGRILCVADIRGKISRLNELAKKHEAVAIIHTGDFGFYDRESIERISDRTLRHLVQYSSLIDPQVRERNFPSSPQQQLSLGQMREKLLNPSPDLIQEQKGLDFILSEFPKLLNGEIKLIVPVYTVWGACEDIAILERIRLAPTTPVTTSNGAPSSSSTPSTSPNEYAIHNLTVLSEGVTRCLVVGGVRLRLFGLGGSLVSHKLFDNGEGNATMAGGNGTMWTTALQIGELIDTAQKVFDPSETRLLVTHASIGREGLLAQIALAIKSDFTLSASLHFRYGTSYNDFATQTDTDSFRTKFVQASKGFMEVYDSVKGQVEQAIDDQQKRLLQNALTVARKVPNENVEEPAWKNSWHWNLPDALYGSLVLDIREGRVGAEMKSTGFNFAYRMKGNPQPLSIGNQGQQPQSQFQQRQQRNNRVPFQQKQPLPSQSQQSQQISQSSVAYQPQPQPQATPSSSGQEGGKIINSVEVPSAAASTSGVPSGESVPAQKAPPSNDAFTSAMKAAFKGGFGGNSRGGHFGPGGRGRGGPYNSSNQNNNQYSTQSKDPKSNEVSNSLPPSAAPAQSSSTPTATATSEKKDGEKSISSTKAVDQPAASDTDWRSNQIKLPSSNNEAFAGEQRRSSGFPRRDGSNGWNPPPSASGEASTGGDGVSSGLERPGNFRGGGRGSGRGSGRGGSFGNREARDGNQNGENGRGGFSGGNDRGGQRGGRGRGGREDDRGPPRGRGSFNGGPRGAPRNASSSEAQGSEKVNTSNAGSTPSSAPAPAPAKEASS